MANKQGKTMAEKPVLPTLVSYLLWLGGWLEEGSWWVVRLVAGWVLELQKQQNNT